MNSKYRSPLEYVAASAGQALLALELRRAKGGCGFWCCPLAFRTRIPAGEPVLSQRKALFLSDVRAVHGRLRLIQQRLSETAQPGNAPRGLRMEQQ